MTTTITYIWGWRKPPGRDIDSVTIYSFFFFFFIHLQRFSRWTSSRRTFVPVAQAETLTGRQWWSRHLPGRRRPTRGPRPRRFCWRPFRCRRWTANGNEKRKLWRRTIAILKLLTIFDGRALIWRPPGFAAIFMSAVTVREAGRRSVSE